MTRLLTVGTDLRDPLRSRSPVQSPTDQERAWRRKNPGAYFSRQTVSSALRALAITTNAVIDDVDQRVQLLVGVCQRFLLVCLAPLMFAWRRNLGRGSCGPLPRKI